MELRAASQPGRRGTWGAVAVLAGFLLLAPPLFVLAPFVLLTLASRPRTLRELLWLGAALVGTGVVLQGSSGLALELIRDSALVLAAVFLLVSMRGGSVLARGLLAVLLTAVAIGIWEASRGVSWPELQSAFTTLLQDSYRALLAPATAGGKPPNPELKSFLQPFIDAAPDFARALPGLLALEGLAGLALASLWHHRLAARPLGRAPAPFRRFRFNDHLIWGAIFTLALLLAPLPAPWKAVAVNLLVLGVGLYATRGLAVVAAVLAPAPGPPKLLAGILAILLFPVALGLCLALGLADTWLDIRGRLAPPAPGGS
ncbi:MAG TPA: DUF2232 domain-containing protein [Gemmatimonadales bacterium]|nr:DUF2232 domain-containing protein [Gemmatimonadales bacterium]